MGDSSSDRRSTDDTPFSRRVAEESARKLRVLRDGNQSVWFGLGMSGLIGWSVAVPTIGGALVGIWLDHRHPGGFSWTLALLAAGLFIGCANAWHWIAEQDKAMHDRPDDKQDVKDE